jgi:hypothetical protein
MIMMKKQKRQGERISHDHLHRQVSLSGQGAVIARPTGAEQGRLMKHNGPR